MQTHSPSIVLTKVRARERFAAVLALALPVGESYAVDNALRASVGARDAGVVGGGLGCGPRRGRGSAGFETFAFGEELRNLVILDFFCPP